MDDDRDPRDVKESLRQAAKALRHSLDLSQDQAAEAFRVRRHRISEIETGHEGTTPELIRELAESLGYRAIHAVRSIDLFELLAADRGRPFDPIGPTPDQEVAIHEAVREMGAELDAMFRDRIRRLNLKDVLGKAAGQWEQLKDLETPRWQAAVRGNADFHNWKLSLFLCEESVRQAADDPKIAVEVARLAVTVARLCTDIPWVGRLVAYAQAHLGNAYRVLGKHREAEVLFEEAHRLWHAPGAAEADPRVLDPGKIYDLEASFRKDQRKLPRALEVLERALPISRVPGRILVNKAIVFSLMGSYEKAIATLRHAAEFLVDPEPRDKFVLSLNTGVNLCHLSRFKEASAFADAAFKIAVDSKMRVDILRCRWLRARVLAGQGDRLAAIDIYQKLLYRFEKLKMFYDLALITLEWAALLLSLGRSRECRSLVVGLPAYFEAKGIHQEALAALKLFCESVHLETANEALAQQVAAFLYLSWGNPGLRFVPASS